MIHAKNLFLIDGSGAIVTTTLLAGVVAQFESTFGMPTRVVYALAAIALGFAVYSLIWHLISPTKWATLLRAIALANLSYCVLTVILMFVYRGEITRLGIAYFVSEILVVSALATYELITARQAADR